MEYNMTNRHHHLVLPPYRTTPCRNKTTYRNIYITCPLSKESLQCLPITISYKRKEIYEKKTYLLTQAAAMSAAINFNRFIICSAKISSGQCKSCMKACIERSFQKISSDIPHPCLGGGGNSKK